MTRVEQHVIEQSHPQFRALDEMALASKNLLNLANYQVRQSFIFEHTYLDNTAIFHLIKHTDAYQALPAKVANQVLVQVHEAWKAFFEAMEVYRAHLVSCQRACSHPLRCQRLLQHRQKSIPDSLWPRDRGHRSSAQTASRLNYRDMTDLS
jgi:hypothetical protein